MKSETLLHVVMPLSWAPLATTQNSAFTSFASTSSTYHHTINSPVVHHIIMARPNAAEALNDLIRGYEYLKPQLEAAKAAVEATETMMTALQQRHVTEKARVNELTARLMVRCNLRFLRLPL